MNKDFWTVIPVAGTGIRLKPQTNTYPKAMVTVAGKPIIGHILDGVKKSGAKKVCVIIGYLGDKIKEYINSEYKDLEVKYVEQKEQKGLGHAIYLTKDYVKGPVFVLLGDTILDNDLGMFTKFDENIIAVKEVKDPRRFGVAEVENGYVTALQEKPSEPKSNLAVVGAYSLTDSAAMFKALEEVVNSGQTTKGEIQFTDALVKMLESGEKIKVAAINCWLDCGKPSTLLATNRHLLNKMPHKENFPGSLIIEPVYISPNASITNSIVGPYASIGAGTQINSCIISDSIINDKAVLANVVLESSLIGQSAVLCGQVQRFNIGDNSEIRFDEIKETDTL